MNNEDIKIQDIGQYQWIVVLIVTIISILIVVYLMILTISVANNQFSFYFSTDFNLKRKLSNTNHVTTVENNAIVEKITTEPIYIYDTPPNPSDIHIPTMVRQRRSILPEPSAPQYELFAAQPSSSATAAAIATLTDGSDKLLKNSNTLPFEKTNIVIPEFVETENIYNEAEGESDVSANIEFNPIKANANKIDKLTTMPKQKNETQPIENAYMVEIASPKDKRSRSRINNKRLNSESQNIA